jgi:hypothetical protein
MRYIVTLALLMTAVLGCKTEDRHQTLNDPDAAAPAKVAVVSVDGRYQLTVNGEPFFIHGAGLEFGNIPALANSKGNSFRTWRTDNGKHSGKEVLDEAYKNGLMVMMGIEVARERHGFDYNDEAAVKEQLDRIRQEVLELKDHPALLLWGIGNELNLRYTNPKVWDAVNDIAKMIHEVDPNHPTTTSLAGISPQEVAHIKERCPEIDILSIQMYGDLPNLPNLIKEAQWEGPYLVTEWGATGHWEVPVTEWGAPIEENSSVKAANYLKRYKKGIAIDSTHCLGSYVFLWGQKQERTPTWYGVFLEDGSETESVDVMEYIWSGNWPENKSPQITAYTLNGKTAYDNLTLEAGKENKATIEITDPDGDVLNYRWEILHESTDLGDGGDFESRPKAVEDLFIDIKDGNLTFKTPEPGNYRLFAYASDGHNHAATANIPFRVK